ncbi:MAG: guanitoxin biosynthesis heme-dependent pre-guanitoxin N-hydroxylase GntA [Chloroflexota bacterium]
MTEAKNPYESEIALANSGYSRFLEGVLVDVESAEPAKAVADRIHSALRAFVLDPEFPCVGSRSALNQGSYRFAMYKEMNTPEATEGLARDLYSFAQEQPQIEGEFTTFIVAFDSPKSLSPEEFEERLWKQLAALHELDREPWDPDVSSDVNDPKFGFSFGGKAFFVVGLSPMAERWARRFPWPALAFNPHAQFEKLREEGRFEKIRDTVRERDAAIEGEMNPNLEDFGDHTEARQYSGRAVDDGWRCPVTFAEKA